MKQWHNSDPSDFSRRLRREKTAGVLLILLGILLSGVGFAVRLTHLEQDETFHFAWQMFSSLAPVLCLGYGVPLLLRARRLLGRPFYQDQARVEQKDERALLIELKAWAGAGRLLAGALALGMLAALALVQLAVFWTCFALFLLLRGSWWLLRRRYWEQM